MQSIATDSILDQIIRPKPLAKRLGVSTTTLWRMRRRHHFPEPIAITAGAKGWRESDIARWLSEREHVQRTA